MSKQQDKPGIGAIIESETAIPTLIGMILKIIKK
jgi:hypothetical protein